MAISGGFLQRQKRMVIYYIKKLIKESQNENKQWCFVVFKTRRELKCQFSEK